MENDRYENVKCGRCGKFYASLFDKCPRCCTHDILSITDTWTGSEPHGRGWIPDFYCDECGKSEDWDMRDLKQNYKAGRIPGQTT
jgi:hypothetical protein